MLDVRDLNSFYGRAHILTDVTLRVGYGEVVALLGRNGAGKSTTLKSIAGLVREKHGYVGFDGAPISALAPHRITKLGLGYVPEDRRIFTGLTVMENLEVGRQPARHGLPVWDTDRLFALFPNLAEMRGRPAGQMSGGEQQMLTIARTLMGNPRMVLLDEPSEGLAPVIVDGMAQAVAALKENGLGVLLSEQNLNFATRLADRAYIIEKGQIRYEGTMSDLMSDESVRQAYLMV